MTEIDIGKDWSCDRLLLLVSIFTIFSGNFCGITFCATMAVIVVALSAIGVNDTLGGVTKIFDFETTFEDVIVAEGECEIKFWGVFTGLILVAWDDGQHIMGGFGCLKI